MRDLRLVGVHHDGEHLLLVDGAGERYLIGVDEALRAAVRRDRAHLGQLQIEIGGGVRPREVQARIRAGASADDVAASCGWPVEKVRRYEGPVLAEREHVAELGRSVRLRRRGGESVSLGSEVARRLAGRGIDPDHVTWDSWRVDDGPWTVAVSFAAGGRERQARWHLDIAGRSVAPADDEARWLSEQVPPGEGPLGSTRLAAVPTGSVYDIEADGGVSANEHDGGPLDLMTAMRSRRRERDAQRGTASRHRPVPGAGAGPADVPGATHPSRRRRPSVPPAAPLEFDPILLADPPAAHPPSSQDAPAEPRPAGRWPLAEQMRIDPADKPVAEPVQDGVDAAAAPVEPAPEPAGTSGRHRGPVRARGHRPSVPSWDDIMFGAKRD